MALDAHSFVIFLRFRKYNVELTPSSIVHLQKMLVAELTEKLPAFMQPFTVSPDPVFGYLKKSTTVYHLFMIQINVILPHTMAAAIAQSV